MQSSWPQPVWDRGSKPHFVTPLIWMLDAQFVSFNSCCLAGAIWTLSGHSVPISVTSVKSIGGALVTIPDFAWHVVCVFFLRFFSIAARFGRLRERYGVCSEDTQESPAGPTYTILLCGNLHRYTICTSAVNCYFLRFVGSPL